MEPSGVLIINKQGGMTSHDVVNRIRRLYGTRRVGHTGTLDPLATGVLTVLVGRAAKAAEYLVADSKEYIATLRLGLTTDTEDITGNTLSVCEDIPSIEQVKAAVKGFEGDIEQIPPMYSALKVDGQKLCDLARKGVSVERKPRPVTIFSIEVSPTDTLTDYILRVSCSSGTYIRTLCADIGTKLGCGGAMATLCRWRAGEFAIENAHTLAELEQMGEDERMSLLRPVEGLFASLPKVNLSEFFEKLSRSGCEIYQKKIRTDFAAGERVRLCSAEGNFYALGEVREYEKGLAIKSIKMFDIE